MNWKKEIKSWGMLVAVFGLLYLTGWITPIMGGIQSLALHTGWVKPDLNLEIRENQDFDFAGRFVGMEGEIINLSDFRGKTLFINKWASWCPPCRAEMPHISALYEKLKNNENIEFLMIAVDKDFGKSKEYVLKNRFQFPVINAAYGLNPSLQSQSIPVTMVINPEGKVVFYQKGMSNFNTVEFQDFLLGL